MQVVGDDGGERGIDAAFDHVFHLVGKRTRRGGLAQHRVAAVAQALDDLRTVEGFVVVVHASRKARVQRGTLHVGQMARRDQARLLHGINRLQKVGETGEDVVADDLGDADRVVALERLLDDLGVENATARLEQRRERHVRRHDEEQVEVGDLVLLDDGLDALQTRNDADLMQVGHDRGGAVLEHGLGKRADREVGAFGMHVRVDEAGRDEHAARIDDLRGRALAILHIADRGDPVVDDRDAAVVDLARVDVDDLAVLDDDVSRALSAGNCQQLHVHANPPCSYSLFPFRYLPARHSRTRPIQCEDAARALRTASYCCCLNTISPVAASIDSTMASDSTR